MRRRHKPPALVSMWMLDVFCCALGCVILLWILESVQSQERSTKIRNTLRALEASQGDLSANRYLLDATRKQFNAEIEDLRGQLAAMLAEKDAKELALVKANAEKADTKKALAIATVDLDELKKKLGTSEVALSKSKRQVDDLELELTKADKSSADLAKQIELLKAKGVDLQKLLRTKDETVLALETAKKTADERLSDLDAKYRNLQKESAELATARTMASDAEKDLNAARKTMADLKKQLDDSNASLIDLQGDKKKLADKYDKLRIDSESRFAGIAMTGKNVVFMIDVSGSMKLIDEKTPDLNKWPTVVETVGKVMRSVPDLDKFQVVLFSSSAKFAFGNGEWQSYKGEASVKAVVDHLKDASVGSDTNLYSAFEQAFKLKDHGLDTIYLFSDGLPTSGPGLTPQEDKTFNDSQRVEALSKFVRSSLRTSWNAKGDGKRVKINSVGFFYESPEVGAFLWGLSRENDGSFVGMSKP